jgi:predicted dehydrogenase
MQVEKANTPCDVADNSLPKESANGRLEFDDSHRMVSLDLAGGALLDLGIYSLTWVFQTTYHLQKEHERPEVASALVQYDTGSDENTTIVVSFPKHKTQGIAMTGLRTDSSVDGKNTGGPAIRIQGSQGEIQVMGPAFKPLQYKVIRKADPGKVEVVDCPIPTDPARGGWGHGMFWEADEAARCLRDGRLESASLPWEESIVIMEVMDKALRDGGVKYPDVITTDVYDAKSPLNVSRK